MTNVIEEHLNSVKSLAKCEYIVSGSAKALTYATKALYYQEDRKAVKHNILAVAGSIGELTFPQIEYIIDVIDSAHYKIVDVRDAIETYIQLNRLASKCKNITEGLLFTVQDNGSVLVKNTVNNKNLFEVYLATEYIACDFASLDSDGVRVDTSNEKYGNSYFIYPHSHNVDKINISVMISSFKHIIDNILNVESPSFLVVNNEINMKEIAEEFGMKLVTSSSTKTMLEYVPSK